MHWELKEKLNYQKDCTDALCFISGEKSGKLLSVAPHWHDELEIVLCGVSGDLLFEGRHIFYDSGDIICIPGGAVHSYTSNEKGCYRVILINPQHLYNIGGSLADNIAEKLFTGKICLPPLLAKKSEGYDELLQCLKKIVYSYETNNVLRIRAAIFTLLSVLYEQSSGKREVNDGYLLIRSAMDFMLSKLSEKITVDQIAKALSVSKYHFIRLFEKYCGMSPISWLIRLRLEKSLIFLQQGESVTTAAFACGFNNLSYYIRKFKEFYGSTPKSVTPSKSKEIPKMI